jgi:LacI family transcriptional regulator
MGFWHEPNNGLKAAIKEINKYKVNTKCLYFDKYDPQSYKQVLAEVLELNPDGVVLAPFFYSISKDFVSALSQKGIPFVLVNIDIEAPDSLTFIGQDSYQSGLMSGKLLNLLLSEQDQVALVRGRKNVDSHHAIDARTKGFLDFFKLMNGSRGIMEIYLEDISPNEIKKVLTLELRKNNHIKGIFIPSTAAFAVAQFLERENLTNMHLVGYDGHENNLKYLKTGTIDFLIDQDPFEQGYLAVKVLFNYLLFNKKPKSKYSSPINILTKENIGFFRKPNESELIA